MVVRILPFGVLLRHMMFVRNVSARALAKKAYLPEDAISMVARGLFMPTPELEHKLRILLDWPESNDELISIIHDAKFSGTPEQAVSPAPVPSTQPQVQAPNPQEPQATPIPEDPVSPKAKRSISPAMQKHMAMMRAAKAAKRARVEDDLVEIIEDSEELTDDVIGGETIA